MATGCVVAPGRFRGQRPAPTWARGDPGGVAVGGRVTATGCVVAEGAFAGRDPLPHGPGVIRAVWLWEVG